MSKKGIDGLMMAADAEMHASPPKADAAPPASPPPRRVWLLAPGSGQLCGALLRLRHRVLFAVGSSYDVNGRRYPDAWDSMSGVALHEADAEETLKCHRRNLATLAGAVYDAAASRIKAVDVSQQLEKRAPAAHDEPAGRSSAWFDRHLAWEEDQPVEAFQAWFDATGARGVDCLVCGSRGGQVTLPALWLLGCRLPAIVVNGGCSRPELAWAWPAGVPVVLLVGGRDFFAGDERGDMEGYLERLWRGVPDESRGSTAIYYCPQMGHTPWGAMLEELLPMLVRYCCSGLAHDARPRLGFEQNCFLATAGCPEGECLPPRYLVERRAEQGQPRTDLARRDQEHAVTRCLRSCGCLPVRAPPLALRAGKPELV